MTLFIIASFVIGIILGLIGLRIVRAGEAAKAPATPNTHAQHHS